MKMKQFLFCAMAFIAALTFTTACMDDLSNQILIPDGAQVIPFTVKAQKDLSTKATVDDEKNLIFEEGDFLKIEGTDIVGQLDLIAGANTTSGTFSGNIYYSGTAPFDENVMLTATLFGANDQTATDPSFSNAICASLADAVRKYSQLGATASYKEFKEHGIGLAMNTSYIDFTVIIDPAPASAQTATIYNNEGAEVLCSGDVMFDAGVARFAAAFPAGTTLTKASLVVNGKDFHFGGASASLTAGSVYTVNKVYQADRFNPLTIKVVRLDNSLTAIPVENPRGMKYRKNGGELTDVPSTGIPVERGDEIQLFGNNASYGDGSATHIFGSDGWGRGDKARCYVYGNVMSLIDSENYATLTKLTADYTFKGLFGGRYAPIYDDPNHSLVLPATTLTKECYRGMFLGCSNMTEAPILPATTLAEGCYKEMFESSWLYEAPMLPAKNLAPLCYNEMFVGCENLSSAPELPATTLAGGCYASMFSGCISLTQAPELPATTLAGSCYSEMFMGCTGIVQAPVLPAETLAERCYFRMLAGCSSLNYIDCRATDISATECTESWVAGVAPTGTFVQAASVTPAWRIESIHGIPIGWSELTPEMIPLSLQALEDGTIHVYNVRSNLSYTKNGADQGAVTSTISVAAGDVLQFYGDNAAYGDGDNPMYFFADNGNDPRCYIYGNVMSLISSTDFASLKELTAPKAFKKLFGERATPILNHPSQKLVLPATTLTTSCYSGMFEYCHLLTEAPELPATDLAPQCYRSMFEDCTGLTVAPALPATTLAEGCYSEMFGGTGLTAAPLLPAPILVDGCYSGMFEGCENLSYIKCLATNIGAEDCTENWVLRVAPSGTFVAASTVTPAWQIESVDGIPIGWTDLAPEEIPLTLAAIEDGTIYIENVRSNLTYKKNGKDQGAVTSSISVKAGDIIQFYGDNASYGDGSPMHIFDEDHEQPRCYIYGNVMSLISSTGFATLKELSAPNTFNRLFGYRHTPILNHPNKKLVLPATTLTVGCYASMFQNCEMLTEAPALPAEVMQKECYSSMFENCSALTTPPALPATSLAEACYAEMFCGSGLTVAPALPATALASACYSAMFMNCKGLTEAPVLKATTLAQECYYEMFSGCKNLNYIKCLATDITAEDCTRKWVENVAPAGTFIAADGMTAWQIDSIDGIPIGWSTVDPLATPLTLEVFETGSGKIYIENVKSNLTYKKNNVDMGAVTSEINVEAGDVIQFYGNNAAYGTENGVNAMHIFRANDATQPKCYIYGNVMSLISSTGFASLTELTAPYAFSGLFRERATPIYNHPSEKLLLPATTLTTGCYKAMFENCPYLTEAPELPATTLADGCYWSMFENCTALAAAPELPATTLAEACYCEMFLGCTALTAAPELPATTLASGCYSTMFMGCTGLTAAPELPAATLVEGCYNEMFRNCSNLSYIKCLATDISASYSRYKWVEGVASTGTFVAAPGMTSWPIDSVDGIPIGWSGGASLDTPLTLEVKSSSGSITINNVMQRSIQYSINGGDRTPLRSDATITISGLHLGDCVQLFGTSPSNGWVSRDSEGYEQYFDDNYWHYTSIACDMDCYVYGNVMSLVDNTNFATNATLTGDFAFMGLFKDNSHIYSHSSKELLLPATSLTKGCYFAMFDNCPNFTEAPELPANAMADYSYMFMFSRTGLSTAPVLPAQTLSMGCYSAMFMGCANLTTAPVLPATTMAEICYYGMFASSGLTAIPSLPATSLAAGCYGVMFSGCTGITSVPDDCLPVTTLAPSCYGGMFQGTSLTKTPNLPATTLAESCYLSMFYGCNSLTEIKPLLATTLAKECYYTMFENCTALTSLPANCLPATVMAPSCYYGMFQGCTNLAHYYASELAAEQLAPFCFYGMFEDCAKLEEAPSFKSTITQMERYCCRAMYSGCSSLTTAPALLATTVAEGCYSLMFRDCIELVNGPAVLPATTLAKECYSSMFWGCKKLEVSPILPAATLVESCYGSMFSGCSSLNRITCLATNKSADKCTWSWWTGVPSTGGTFVKSPLVDAAFWAHDGYGGGAPTNWTIIDYSE